MLNVRSVVSLIVTVAAFAATRAVAADESKAAAQTTVQVKTDRVYYELPRWSVGTKMTAYCSDYAGGKYPSDPKRAKQTTPDGKNWITCLKEMKLGFIGASMWSQGRPPNKGGKPDANYDDWRAAAGAVVDSGGGIMIEYLGGVGPAPGMPNGTTTMPEVADNVDPYPGAWSPQNCVDWADYMASLHGADKICLFEFYNEPDCVQQRKESPGRPFWYSSKDVKEPDRLCSDWATNHQQDYYKPVKAKYPDAVICGASYSTPAGPYNSGTSARYLQGYPGARVSKSNPNTKYQDATSLHSYGFRAGKFDQNAPGAASGTVQAVFNSIFYPTLKEPGKVSGYKAGVDQWIETARRLPGGKTNGVVDTEWWVYGPKPVAKGLFPTGGKDGSRQAVGDVLGWIVHCQNADRWQFRAIEYHAANASPAIAPDAKGRPAQYRMPDCFFCACNGKLFRLGRYFAIKDICARFANNYPSLVRCDVHGPKSPAGPRDNSPGTQIQSCAALNKDKSSLAVCLANIGDSKQTVTIALGKAASGAARGVVIPPSLDVETPLTKVSPEFVDDAHESVTVTLEGFTAALIEVGLN